MSRLDRSYETGGAIYTESHLAYPAGHTWLIQSVRVLLSVSASAASGVQSGRRSICHSVQFAEEEQTCVKNFGL